MKLKKIALFVMLAVMLASVEAYAAPATALNYGDIVSRNTYEGSVFAYNYGVGGSFSTATAHRGKKSYMTDFSIPDANLNLHVNTISVYEDYAYYAEAYIKTENIDIGSITNVWFEAATGSNKQGAQLTRKETDKNGWSRYSAYRKTPTGQTDAKVFMYFKLASGKLYVDDIIIRVAPYSLRVTGTTTDVNTVVNLNKLACYGADKNGNEKRIYLNNMKKWSVKSGNATVDQNGNLKWNDSTGGIAQVQLEFCGATTTFNVEFTSGFSVAELTKSGDTYIVTAKNSLAEAEKINCTIALYDDDGRLYKTKSEVITIQSGEEKEIQIKAIAKPYFIKNGKQKIMVSAPNYIRSFICE